MASDYIPAKLADYRLFSDHFVDLVSQKAAAWGILDTAKTKLTGGHSAWTAAQAEADSKKIEAEAEAKAIELIQTQLANSPNYIEYLKITNWNGILPQAIGDGVNPFLVLGSAGGSTTDDSTRKTQTPAAATDAVG